MCRYNIEVERMRKRLKKQDMCDALGVTLKTYNGYINGHSIPSSKLMIMRDIFNCSIDYLLAAPATRGDIK